MTIGASQGLLQQPDAARQGAALPAPFGKQGGQRGGIGVPAEDIEIASGPVEPNGDGAHQRQVLAQLPQLIPQPRGQQGMSRALACVAKGQVVEAAPVGACGARRWKNCGRGRSRFIWQKSTISRQGSPW
ncbi:hypothetical protein D3C78_1430970 [compost metagenome]